MINLEQLIDKAFDYRGDVTLDLKSGQHIEGYIFNRDHAKQTLTLFIKGESTPKPLAYTEITDIRFTGENTAAGKSWEDWKTKHGKE
ncbi:MAG: hypothetical protein Q7T03_10715 [Deltaproteobacteria bacterium]|nr:hypothetical protein [Deltaproteobacteria bacterium]